MIWDDWDQTGKDFWDSTVKFWTADDTDWDIDSYDSMSHYASYNNPFRSYAEGRKNELYNHELDRWYDDHYKYTGQDLRKTRYPILQNRRRLNDEFTALQVSDSVRDFYTLFNRW